MNPRARLAALTLPLLVAGLLSGCDTFTPDPETVTVDLGTTTLEVDVPGDFTVGTGSIGATPCVDSQTVLSDPDDRAYLALATASAATACPEVEPLNGRFPSWASAADLPEHAEPFDVGDLGTGYRFAVEYTECTNSCTDYDRLVTFVELADGTTFQAVSLGLQVDDYEAMIASLRVV